MRYSNRYSMTAIQGAKARTMGMSLYPTVDKKACTQPLNTMDQPVVQPIIPHPLEMLIANREIKIHMIPTTIEVKITIFSSNDGANPHTRIAGNNPKE